MEHTCHAIGCTTVIEPRLFMCKPHWFTLPENMRDAIWKSYRPGQETDKRPSPQYVESTRHAEYWLQAYEMKQRAEKIAVAAQNPMLF